MQTFVNSIQKLLKQKLNICTTVLTPTTNLKSDLQLADWEMYYLLNAVEQKWHINIEQDDPENIGSIEQLLATIKKHSGKPMN